MLLHPFILDDPQRQALGVKAEVVPDKREQNEKWLPQPCVVTCPKERENATSPRHSWTSPVPSAGSKIRSGPQQRGTKSEMVASPLPSNGRKRGWKCRTTPALSGVPNAKRGEHNQKCLHQSIVRDPQPKHRAQIQRWTPTKGVKIRSGCLSPTCSAALESAEMLRHPCILGDPQRRARGAK